MVSIFPGCFQLPQRKIRQTEQKAQRSRKGKSEFEVTQQNSVTRFLKNVTTASHRIWPLFLSQDFKKRFVQRSQNAHRLQLAAARKELEAESEATSAICGSKAKLVIHELSL